MEYRREIDGLRAIAVLPVIFYHAGFKAFEGGFVGVDIFFVISGYLITNIILSDMNHEKFSIVTFYERRARRILPALFFVMFCCFPFAWLWLMPSHMMDFSQSLTAISFFSSNILFWSESGYFATAGELKPLLHTWSLAVEEQYYILFPLFLMALWKLRKRWILGSFILIAFSSLALAQWGAYQKPSATFFLLPTRGWELAIGALISFYFLYKKNHLHFVTSNKAISEVLGFIGMSLICYSIFMFNKSTPFPSFYALIPTVGTALIIIFSTSTTVVGRLLSIKPMVGIGLISYSAYLWHQPLFVFERHRNMSEPNTFFLLFLSILSIGLAYISWRFVEIPFRNKKAISRKAIFRFAVFGSMFFAGIGLLGHLTEGFKHREIYSFAPISKLAEITDVYNFFNYNSVVRNFECHTVSMELFEENGCIDIREKNIFLWGDSYAASLYPGLDYVRSIRHPDYGITQMTDGNGPPFYAEGMTDDGKTLESANNNRLLMVEKYKPDVILIAWMIDGENAVKTKEKSLTSLNNTIKKISKSSPNSRIVVVGPFPAWSGSLQKQLINYSEKNMALPPLYISEGLLENHREWDFFYNKNIGGGKAEYLSSQDYLCNEDGCLTRLSSDITDLTAIDWGHLSKNGSIYLAKKIEHLIYK